MGSPTSPLTPRTYPRTLVIMPAWNEEEIALDKNGYARHKFPHRTPNWDQTITCTQQ